MTSADRRWPAAGAALADALSAPRFDLAAGDGCSVAYYADTSGQGRPLVLIHSINAAASSFEMKPLLDAFRGRRPVYSLDLPGFGHSDRSDRPYTPEFYAQAIRGLLQEVVRRPADLVALSLSGELAARAAALVPDLVASLTLISPTGFGRQALPSPKIAGFAHRALSLPWLGRALFALVASRPSIRHFLGRSLLGEPPQAMLDYAYLSAHQPGAWHAPLTFLSTRLFTPNAIDVLYGRLTRIPVLVIADQDPYIGFERLAGFVAVRPNWHRIDLAPHKGLPHWERPAETIEALDHFWSAD